MNKSIQYSSLYAEDALVRNTLSLISQEDIVSFLYVTLLWHQRKIVLGKVKQKEDLSKTTAIGERDCTQLHRNKMLFKHWNELDKKYWRTLEWRLINWDHTELFRKLNTISVIIPSGFANWCR